MDDALRGDAILPFAKRSQVVRRFLPQPVASRPPFPAPEQPYDSWHTLIRQPRAFESGAPGATSGCPVWRSGAGGVGASGLEPLPHPSDLCRRRRRRRRNSVNEGQALSVQQHIQELWRKQRSIDQLKSMKWGGYDHSQHRPHQEHHTFLNMAAGYEEDTGSFFSTSPREDTGSFFSTSPREGPIGVVFPWMSPGDHSSASYLESSLEEPRRQGGFFYME